MPVADIVQPFAMMLLNLALLRLAISAVAGAGPPVGGARTSRYFDDDF